MPPPGIDVKGTKRKIITAGKCMDFHPLLPNLSSQKPCRRTFAVTETIHLPLLNCQNAGEVGGLRGVLDFISPRMHAQEHIFSGKFIR